MTSNDQDEIKYHVFYTESKMFNKSENMVKTYHISMLGM